MGDRKPGTSGNRFTQKRKEIYLAELRRVGLKPAARLAANISNTCVSYHLKRYPEFHEAEENALTAHKLEFHEEIKRRGMEGVCKPHTIAGQREMVREYSDRLLMEYARRFDPEFRPQVKVDQHTTGSIAVGLEDLSRLDREGRDLLRKLLQCELAPDLDDDGEEASDQ